MGFLIGEIIAFLAGAALIGLFIGWALFGGKKQPAPANAADAKASKEALKKAETRIKELEGERQNAASSLTERDDEIAQLRHQIAQTEQYRIETAGKIDQLKTQVGVLQEQLKQRDADLALAGSAAAPGTGVALAELTQQLKERDLELKKLQVKYDELKDAAGPEAPTVADLRAQITELRAVLESPDILTSEDPAEVSELKAQNAKLSEENLGLKAAYEAAERSLEEQDGAMDQLSQVLLKSQQEAAQLRQEVAGLKAQAGRSAERGGVAPPPPVPPMPLAAVDAADEDDATRAIAAFELPEDDAPAPPPPVPDPLPVPPAVAEAPLPTPVVEEVEPEEATMAIPAFDLPDSGPPQLPPADDDAEEATVAMPVFDLDEDTELDTDAGPEVPASDDDLKQIKGIGPAIEKRIKSAGIATWAQLAALDDAGVESLAAEIKVSASKIMKDAWIEQARELQAEG